MKSPKLLADPRYLEAFGKLMKKIEAVLPSRSKPVRIHVAGGAALHLYTGARYSRDVGAHIALARVALPPDLHVVYDDSEGLPKTLHYDTAYNESFALLHEDVHEDSLAIRVPGIDPKRLDVRLFSPVDLAVSKLSRFEAHDREDILALAKAGLVSSASLRERAEEALPGYVGDVARLRNSLKIAIRMLEEAGY
jgi:hypothetical protein